MERKRNCGVFVRIKACHPAHTIRRHAVLDTASSTVPNKCPSPRTCCGVFDCTDDCHPVFDAGSGMKAYLFPLDNTYQLIADVIRFSSSVSSGISISSAAEYQVCLLYFNRSIFTASFSVVSIYSQPVFSALFSKSRIDSSL